jgi:hypothetical protein
MVRIWRVMVYIGVAVLATGPGQAADIDLSLDLGQDQFELLVDHLAEAVDMPGAPAKPLGTTGFSLEVGSSWIEANDGAEWWRRSVRGSSDLLDGSVGYRAALRKGLPGNFDIGLQAGSILGADYYSAELRRALVAGGVGRPSIGARVVWTRLAEGPLDLELATAHVTLSKGLKILAPYAAVGLRWVRADASLEEGDLGFGVEVDESVLVGSAGIRLNITPLNLNFELRHAAATAFFASAGFGF